MTKILIKIIFYQVKHMLLLNFYFEKAYLANTKVLKFVSKL